MNMHWRSFTSCHLPLDQQGLLHTHSPVPPRTGMAETTDRLLHHVMRPRPYPRPTTSDFFRLRLHHSTWTSYGCEWEAIHLLQKRHTRVRNRLALAGNARCNPWRKKPISKYFWDRARIWSFTSRFGYTCVTMISTRARKLARFAFADPALCGTLYFHPSCGMQNSTRRSCTDTRQPNKSSTSHGSLHIHF